MHEQNKLANPIYKHCKSIVEGGLFFRSSMNLIVKIIRMAFNAV